MNYNPLLLCPWDFPGKNTGVGCHSLLQGIVLTRELSLSLLHLLHWQADSSPLLAGCISVIVLGINITQSYPMDGRVSLRED